MLVCDTPFLARPHARTRMNFPQQAHQSRLYLTPLQELTPLMESTAQELIPLKESPALLTTLFFPRGLSLLLSRSPSNQVTSHFPVVNRTSTNNTLTLTSPYCPSTYTRRPVNHALRRRRPTSPHTPHDSRRLHAVARRHTLPARTYAHTSIGSSHTDQATAALLPEPQRQDVAVFRRF